MPFHPAVVVPAGRRWGAAPSSWPGGGSDIKAIRFDADCAVTVTVTVTFVAAVIR